MKTLSGIFSKRCADEYRAIGFSRVKGSFVRLSNDVLHAFSLKRYRYAPACTVEFSIIPLCGGIPVSLDAGYYELSSFNTGLQDDWEYDSKSIDSIVLCVETLIQTMNRTLIPLFAECGDCKSALPALIKLEELFESNRLKCLELRGWQDHAQPWQERSMFDSRKFYMALKACDYVYAEKYLRFQIEYCQRTLELMEKPDSTKQPEIVKKRMSENLNVCSEFLGRLTSGDYSFFDDLLLQNEAKTKEWLLDRYPTISKLFDAARYSTQ